MQDGLCIARDGSVPVELLDGELLCSAGPSAYAACAVSDNPAQQTLAPGELSLSITADGRVYRCTRGGAWSQLKGPRLIESGRFVQRADVTDLVFTAEDGSRLNVEARFETAAWPDRLGLILAARPGLLPIPVGEGCFGRAGGGFGLDGTNHLEIPPSPELDPERFTLEFWAFVPTDCRASERTPPWIVCKNRNEEAEGNYGILLLGETLRATMNIGGGRANVFFVDASRRPALRSEAWNHLAMSYDGDALRLFVNGEPSGERKIGRKRVPGKDGLAFGRRQDNCGDGYHFRGVVDEIRLYDRALTLAEVRQRATRPEAEDPAMKPVRQWSFRADGRVALSRPGESWRDAAIGIRLATPGRVLHHRWESPRNQPWTGPEWHEAFLAFNPASLQEAEPGDTVTVQASELPGGTVRPVDFDPARGWHRVNLDGIVPTVPPGGQERQNDVIERIRLVLSNHADQEQIARLLFEINSHGFRQSIGSAITGMSAILRDAEGHPTGIPVQLSKNWHGRPEGGVYAGQWFHGFSQVRLPPRATAELELTIVYGHWGGVAAASHAQLCLIGWGSNQLWDEAALGSWGESICFEPDQVQAQAAILDVRPAMVLSMNHDLPWSWTHNVGGGDFFRLFDSAGNRVFPGRMRTAYHRDGPCLTEVTYAGRTGRGIEHSATVSLCRSDDIVRGLYRLRMDVNEPLEFSRLAFFQIGADTYSYTGERKMALGNEAGLRAYLEQCVMDGMECWTPTRGTPQGAVISPLLSNLYLDPLDSRMTEQGFEMTRYADDFVIQCRSEAEARAALAEVERWTAQAGLALHPAKPRIVDLRERGSGFDFLGYHFERGHRRPRAKSLGKLKEAIRAKTHRANGHSLAQIIADVNRTLRGWFEYFKHSCRSSLREVDQWVRGRLRSILRKRSGRRGKSQGPDHLRWPNAFFDAHGLLSLFAARMAVCQPSRR